MDSILYLLTKKHTSTKEDLHGSPCINQWFCGLQGLGLECRRGLGFECRFLSVKPHGPGLSGLGCLGNVSFVL